MICDPWDVVVVPFPFTERAAAKRRPALIISKKSFNRNGHSIMAMITSAWHQDWPGDVRLNRSCVRGFASGVRRQAQAVYSGQPPDSEKGRTNLVEGPQQRAPEHGSQPGLAHPSPLRYNPSHVETCLRSCGVPGRAGAGGLFASSFSSAPLCSTALPSARPAPTSASSARSTLPSIPRRPRIGSSPTLLWRRATPPGWSSSPPTSTF